MGGFGSGGWNATGRPTTADLPCLDVNRLNKFGALQRYFRGDIRWKGNDGEERVNIHTEQDCISLHDAGDGGAPVDVIGFTWEPCRFGGRRPFFICPDCGQRTLHLYLLGHFACRSCHDLSYPSQRERESDRAQRRANRIRMRLGGEPGWLNVPPRPKGMHLRTYLRQVGEILEADDITRQHAASYI